MPGMLPITTLTPHHLLSLLAKKETSEMGATSSRVVNASFTSCGMLGTTDVICSSARGTHYYPGSSCKSRDRGSTPSRSSRTKFAGLRVSVALRATV